MSNRGFLVWTGNYAEAYRQGIGLWSVAEEEWIERDILAELEALFGVSTGDVAEPVRVDDEWPFSAEEKPSIRSKRVDSYRKRLGRLRGEP